MRLRYFRLARALVRSTQPKKRSSKRVQHQPKLAPRAPQLPKQHTYRAAQPPPPQYRQMPQSPAAGQSFRTSPPPQQPGQFQPPPQYTYPPPPPYVLPPNRSLSSPHRYRGWMLFTLVMVYIIAMGFLFLEMIVQSGTPTDTTSSSSSGSGILGTSAVLLLLVLHGFIIILDGRSFFTLFGRIQWNQTNGWLKALIVIGYLCVFIMPCIYLLYAVQNFLRMRQQTFVQAFGSGWQWYRGKSSGTQLAFVMVSFILVLSFVAFTSFAATADRSRALALLTPTPAPQQTALTTYAATSTSTSNEGVVSTATIQPTATVKPTATPRPTPRPTPTPTHPAPTPCPGINCNPWGYNFTPGNLIYNPPSNFCSYFTCIASFWESDDPDDGYVVQCNDGNYSQSGGERGACSYHAGVSRPLYSH
jgi:hypothetical protein